MKFGLDTTVIDQRLIQDAGEDEHALTEGDPVDPSNLAKVFQDDRFADRRTNELDPYVRYIAINTAKVPNLEHRKAIAVAMDRAELRTVAGGEYAGDLGDGVIKPNLPADYAPSPGCSPTCSAWTCPTLVTPRRPSSSSPTPVSRCRP